MDNFERMNEWTNEWMNEWMNEWISHQSVSQSVSQSVNQSINQPINQRTQHLFLDETFVDKILFDDVFSQFIEPNLVSENVQRHSQRPAKSSRALVVVKDRVETRSVSIEEVLVSRRVIVSVETKAIAEQRVGEACQRPSSRLVTQATDVEDHFLGRPPPPRTVHHSCRRRRHRLVVVVDGATSGVVNIVGREAAALSARLHWRDLAVTKTSTRFATYRIQRPFATQWIRTYSISIRNADKLMYTCGQYYEHVM